MNKKLNQIKEQVKKEFPKDELLREIHEIRAIHYEQTKNLTAEEKARKINQEAEEVLRNMRIKLKPK